MNLKDLQDKHKGQMGFVIGAGPSLHFQDVSPLKDYVTVATNSGILKVPDCDYYVTDDEGVVQWNYWRETARKSKAIKLLYETKLKNHASLFKPEDYLFFGHKTWYDPSTKKFPEGGLVMTKDAEAPIIGARTSLASAIHWAYIMGCDPIVLLGADCCYRGNKRYFWQFPGETRAFQYNGQPVWSTPNKGKKDGQPVDSHCVDFLEYWRQFAEVNKDIANIIYASEGGILKCFPSMTLKESLQKYGERKKL